MPLNFQRSTPAEVAAELKDAADAVMRSADRIYEALGGITTGSMAAPVAPETVCERRAPSLMEAVMKDVDRQIAAAGDNFTQQWKPEVK